MALLHNTVIASATLGFRKAGLEAPLPLSGGIRSERRNWFAGDHTPDKLGGTPVGTLPPASLLMPQKSGGMGSFGNIAGTTTISPLTMAGGVNGQATLTGAGDITAATAQLVISMVATLAGSSTLSTADLRGYLNAVANLSGGGTLAAAIGALAWADAALSGTGTISNATPYATGTLSANIRGYSDLTPEGITDKVWNAALANYQATGSAGKALSTASSGGVDLNAMAAAVWAYATRTLTSGAAPTESQIATAVMTYAVESGWSMEQMMRVFAAVLAGKVSGAGTGTEVFRAINDTKPRVTATTDSNGNRSAITLDPN